MAATDQNTLEFAILKERMDAQIEVYEKVLQTYGRILELLEQDSEKIDQLKGDCSQDIEKIIDVINELQRSSNNIVLIINTLQGTINSSNEILQNLVQDIKAQKELIENIAPALKELTDQLVKHGTQQKQYEKGNNQELKELQSKIEEFVTELQSSNENINTKFKALDNVPMQLQSLYKEKLKRQSWIVKAGYWIAGFAAFWILMQAAAQLGWVSFNWFPK